MFITRKHIPRRAVLKAAGVALGLPFLDAMVPAGTALAQTAAVPKLRTGFFYIPHGAIMGNTSHGPALDKWTPSGSGADFKLSPILASLEPYKKYISSFGNLQNAATAGSVHSFTPATWLSATAVGDAERSAINQALVTSRMKVPVFPSTVAAHKAANMGWRNGARLPAAELTATMV